MIWYIIYVILYIHNGFGKVTKIWYTYQMLIIPVYFIFKGHTNKKKTQLHVRTRVFHGRDFPYLFSCHCIFSYPWFPFVSGGSLG